MRSRYSFAVLLLLAGCEKGDQPAEPVWGKQACASCGMVVSDRRTAAEIVTSAGDRVFFDDAGCMVVWSSKHAQPQHAWVRNADDQSWIAPQAAKWVSGVATPMDFGWEAHSNGVAWETMRTAVLARAESKR